MAGLTGRVRIANMRETNTLRQFGIDEWTKFLPTIAGNDVHGNQVVWPGSKMVGDSGIIVSMNRNIGVSVKTLPTIRQMPVFAHPEASR